MSDNSRESGKLITRRSLLGGAVAGVGATALSGATGVTEAWGSQPLKLGKVQQELQADVVVAGAGMGGLSAAVRAAQQGARVILLEKAPHVGGTASHSEGGVANSEYDDMRLNSPDGDPVVQRNVYDNVEKWYAFMEEINAPMTRAIEGMTLGGQQQGSRRQGRTIAPIIWVRFMAGELESRGGTILTGTPITRLLSNSNRQIVGVEAEGPNGHVRIRTKAVILATGGWMHNDKMINENITRHKIWQRNVSQGRDTPLFTGDGFNLAQELGAAPSKGGWDAFYGYLLPALPGFPREPMANVSMYHAHYGVALNLYGYRFADESGGKWGTRGRDRFTRRGAPMIANEACRQVEASAISIWDEEINRQYACADCALGGVDKLEAFRQVGAPTAKADTIEDLARQIQDWNRGTPAERIVQQVQEYNTAAAADKTWMLPVPKTGSDFGHTRPLTNGPLYAVLGTSGLTATFGGLRVNENGNVRDRNDRPITGLFAAGIDIGGFSTYGYLGNLTLGASHGYLSGTNAAKQPDPSGGWTPTFQTSSALR